MLALIPRDLRNAVTEVSQQADQLGYMRAALERLSVPVTMIHGDLDDFAPIEIVEKLVKETHTRRPIRFERIKGVKHVLTDGPADVVIACLEACIPKPEPIRLGLPKLKWRWPPPLASKFAASGQSS
jgi:pimeloyl-ACP methyl ester carboxylesterase